LTFALFTQQTILNTPDVRTSTPPSRVTPANIRTMAHTCTLYI